MRSMTGYGRYELLKDNLDILVEIRSVNHRYFEFSLKTPKAYGYIEAPIKNLIKDSVSRGKIETSVYIIHPDGKKACVSVNKELAKGYIDALNTANEQLGLENDLSLSSLLKFADIFNVSEIQEEESELTENVLEAVENALSAFVLMREEEGENLKKDILAKLEYIDKRVCEIEEIAPSFQENYYNRLLDKLNELIGNGEIETQRLITEAAIFAEKTAIDEETVRLHSHISQMRNLVETTGSIGKKLDFIIQEMNREVNTIGSKALNAQVTTIVVDLKSEIEKIREQIQNVE